MLGDIQIFDEVAYGYPGDDTFQVTSGAAASINAGEPVGYALGQRYAAALATNKPVVGTDFMAGIASSTSTDTASAAGVVKVTKMTPDVTYLIAPKVAATWDTQSEYNALVGARVLFDLTSGVYTILASDGSTNGLVVRDLDVTKYPGKVRFAIRNAVDFRS